MSAAGNTIPEAIASRLFPDERLIWWDRPGQGIVLSARDGFLIPFSLVWGGFAIFWEAAALKGRAPLPMALFGIPFVLLGLFMIFGRFLVDAWLRRRTIYALTDRRILIARSAPRPSFRAVSLDRLPEATLIEGAGGCGTIRFGQQGAAWANTHGSTGFGAWIPALDPTPQFVRIDDAQRVFAAVQEHTQRHV